MVWRTVRCRTGGRMLGIAALALAIVLGGCDPIESYRSLSGIAKNDPDPKTAPFTSNLAEAAAAPYPNLATVPPPPTRATGTAERQKLAQSLIADRTATAAASGLPPPVPAAAATPAGLPPGPERASGPPPAAAAAAPAAPGKPAAKAGPAERRKPGEPATPQPLNATLQMPQVRSVPEPETARPPPPAPSLAAVPPPPIAPAPPPSATLGAAIPEPPPPVPVLAPPPPPPAPPPSVKAPRPPPPAAVTVATLAIPAASAALDQGDEAQIAHAAALYKKQPGTVRVVGYAAAPSAGGDPLASYRAALDRAQAVAKALAAAGVPAGKIQTEANPAGGAATGRVEIQFQP